MPTSTIKERPSYSAGLPVHLEPDSLYVSTIPLTEGFHWALIHVDPHGNATRHHWAATTNDPHGPEGYVCQPMSNGPRMKAGQQPILAYFKIAEYVPIALPMLQDMCAAAFPRGSACSALQNRAANMSPRTWITRVLGRLLPVPAPSQRAVEIEDFVNAHSHGYGDAYARAFLFRQSYTTLVLSVIPCESPAAHPVHGVPSDPPSCIITL